MEAMDKLRECINEFKDQAAMDTARRAEKTRALGAVYQAISGRLGQLVPEREREISVLVKAITANDGRDATPAALDDLAKRIAALQNEWPSAFFPPEKLTRAIEAARKARPNGLVIFGRGVQAMKDVNPTSVSL
jgi:hypothetical protein